MFGLSKRKSAAAAHEKITQLVHMVSHTAHLMGRESAINVLRNHGLIRQWNEGTQFGGTNYSFAFEDQDIGDFSFCIDGDTAKEDEVLAIHIFGGVDYAGFYGYASIPAQKYIVNAKDAPRYPATSKAKLLVNFFVRQNGALDTSRL